MMSIAMREGRLRGIGRKIDPIEAHATSALSSTTMAYALVERAKHAHTDDSGEVAHLVVEGLPLRANRSTACAPMTSRRRR